jgi:insertion element IS1 protein InsB
MVSHLLCESVGIRGIARILQIGINTVMKRIGAVANRIVKPVILMDQPSFEVDELWTYVGQKENEYWLAYALDRRTRQVVDFVIGKRTKATLKGLIDNLLASGVRMIRTDKLSLYQRLIPKHRHCCGTFCINRIERKNLSIRTHIKRLSRRTICFSRKLAVLENCLRIYFWTGQRA